MEEMEGRKRRDLTARVMNIEYGGIWSMYWAYYGVLLSFGSVYLLGKGFSNYEIGLLFALAGIFGAVIQPPIADVVDHSEKFRVHRMLELLAVVMILLAAGLFLFPSRSLPLFLVYLVLYALHLALQGLINAMTFALEKTGHHINFGVCRGMGSVTYSVLMVPLGAIVDRYGSGILPGIGLALMLGYTAFLIASDIHYLQACRKAKEVNQPEEKNTSAEMVDEADDNAAQPEADSAKPAAADPARITLWMFLKRNKLFLVLSIGVMCHFFGNAVQNTFFYQIIENVGGTSADMGTAAAIGAIMEVPLLFFFDNVRKRVPVTVLLKVCEVAFVLKFLILVLADNVFMVYLSQVLQGIYILIVPGMVYLIGATMAPGEAVKGQTWYVVSTTVASVLASFAGGWILDLAGAKSLCMVGLVLAAAGCLIFFLFVDKVAAGSKTA